MARNPIPAPPPPLAAPPPSVQAPSPLEDLARLLGALAASPWVPSEGATPMLRPFVGIVQFTSAAQVVEFDAGIVPAWWAIHIRFLSQEADPTNPELLRVQQTNGEPDFVGIRAGVGGDGQTPIWTQFGVSSKLKLSHRLVSSFAAFRIQYWIVAGSGLAPESALR